MDGVLDSDDLDGGPIGGKGLDDSETEVGLMIQEGDREPILGAASCNGVPPMADVCFLWALSSDCDSDLAVAIFPENEESRLRSV